MCRGVGELWLGELETGELGLGELESWKLGSGELWLGESE